MTDLLRVLLPTYFTLYVGIAFVAKSIITAKRIGKTPLVLPKGDSAYGLIGRYFKGTMMLLFLYVLLFAFQPKVHEVFLSLFNNLND